MNLKVGVIGVGRIGEHHLRNYRAIPGVELVGVHDIRPEQAEPISNKYGIRYFSEMGDLLDKVDAVSICVPTDKHAEVFEKVASAGKHALVEKPISLTLEEADRMLAAAKSNNVKLMVGQVERFNPVIPTVRDIVDLSGIVYLELQRLGPYNKPDTAVGVVKDLMIHDIDVALSLIGADVKSVEGRLMKVFSETDDIAHAILGFTNGVTAALTASRVTNYRVRQMNITLRDSYVSADFHTQEVLIRSGLLPEYVGGKNVSYKQVSAIEIPYVQRGEPLRLELESFVDSVSQDKEVAVTGIAGKNNLEVALRILTAGQ
jgi:predicted dehydrogenase